MHPLRGNMFRILTPPPRSGSLGNNEVMFILETLDKKFRDGTLIGRGDIAAVTGIREGAVRAILQRLERMGFVRISNMGVILLPTGSDFLRAMGITLMELDHTTSAIGVYQVSLLVRGMADRINKGVEQRDSGLKSGGDGCTTIVCREGELILPPDWDVEENTPKLASQIRAYGISEGDIVLIGGSNTDRTMAAAAANSAALELLEASVSEKTES